MRTLNLDGPVLSRLRLNDLENWQCSETANQAGIVYNCTIFIIRLDDAGLIHTNAGPPLSNILFMRTDHRWWLYGQRGLTPSPIQGLTRDK